MADLQVPEGSSSSSPLVSTTVLNEQAKPYGQWGCSPQAEGVDDDLVGVALNYACGVFLFWLALHLFWTHSNAGSGSSSSSHARSSSSPRRLDAKVTSGILTELGMGVGYLTGGIVHHLFPNRAVNNHCAAWGFYPVFCVSYLGMIVSALAWLGVSRGGGVDEGDSEGFGRRRPIRSRHSSGGFDSIACVRCVTECLLVLSAIFIVVGSTWCELGGATLIQMGEKCSAGKGQATCDAVMMAGEGIFYVVWIFAWAVVAAHLDREYFSASTRSERPEDGGHGRCLCFSDRALNWAAPLVLLVFGPGQILAVSLLPVVFARPGESMADIGATSLDWYCKLRTGVTYILAVLACHFFTFLISGRIFSLDHDVDDGRFEQFEAGLGECVPTTDGYVQVE